MKINHRISARYDDPFWLEVDRLSLAYDRGEIISVLNVTEDQPEWSEVERLVAEYGPAHVSTNVFTQRELDGAEWLNVLALGHHGYPQPEDDFGYIKATYDISNLCDVCGMGGVQKMPFRLRAEPKGARSQFLQLNWVYDEFFLRSKARQGLSAAGLTGFEFYPALLHGKNRPSAEVQQLKILNLLPPALDSSELQPVTCTERNEEWWSMRRKFPNFVQATAGARPYCGRVKYHLKHRGPLRFDPAALAGAPDVVRTNEWFGSGAQAFRLVLVSQRFHQTVENAKWRGLSFEPIELIGAPA